jgi:hypothetical protein
MLLDRTGFPSRSSVSGRASLYILTEGWNQIARHCSK